MPKWQEAPPVEQVPRWQQAPAEGELKTSSTLRRLLSNGASFVGRHAPLPMRAAVGLAEGVAETATGAVATPIAGWAGLGSAALTPGTPMERTRAAAETVGNVQGAMTYQPRTPQGKAVSGLMSVGPRLYHEGAQYIGDLTGGEGEEVGSALVTSALEAAPALIGARMMTRRTAGPRPTARQSALQRGNQQGYVAPPSSAATTRTAPAIEGMGGKLKTQQQASVRNQAITNRIAARELGLPAETELSTEVTAQVRSGAQPAYEAIRSAGNIPLTNRVMVAIENAVKQFRAVQKSTPSLAPKEILAIADEIKANPSMDASVVVDNIRTIRDSSSVAYRSGNAGLGRAYKNMATALEDAIEAHLPADSSVLTNFRSARELIAKSYTIENSLKGGNVDAGVLARQLDRGKPLSGGLREIAGFAGQFPSASRVIRDSVPAYSPLDAAYQAGSAAAALGTGNPALALPAAYSLGRPGIRAYMLSPAGQRLAYPAPYGNALAWGPGSGVLAMGNALANEDVQ